MTESEMHHALASIVRTIEKLNLFNQDTIKAQGATVKAIEHLEAMLTNLNERIVFVENMMLDHAKVIGKYSEAREDEEFN